MPTIHLTLPRPHEGQRAMLTSSARWRVACCGRRWGKSTLAVNRLIGPALEGFPVAYFSPTYGMLTEVWREFARVLRPVLRRTNAQEHRMELVTGGVLDMWSLDTPDVARGRKYRRVGLDEAAMVDHLLETFNLVIRPTLADYAGDADFYSTPRGFNDFHTLYARGQGADPDWQSWHQPTSANPFIPASEIAAMRAEMTSLQFAQEVLAEFVNLEGGTFKRAWLKVVDPAAVPPLGQTVLFADLATSTKTTADYSAFAVVGVDADANLYILDMIRGRWEWPDARKVLIQTVLSHRLAVLGVESTAFQLAAVQDLRNDPLLLGTLVQDVRPDKDKVSRALPWAARAEAGKVYLVQGAWCAGFLDEVADFPQGPHDDQIDAVSGAVSLLSAGTPRGAVITGPPRFGPGQYTPPGRGW